MGWQHPNFKPKKEMKMKMKMKKKLVNIIKNNENFIEHNDAQQAILDHFQYLWEDEDLCWAKYYGERLQYFNEKYGNIAALAVMLTEYDSQVSNGGHYQYYSDGYASWYGADPGDISLHKLMVKYLKESSFLNDYPELFEKVLEITDTFFIELADENEYDEQFCGICRGTGILEEVDEEDEQTGEYEICYECEGSGVIRIEIPYDHITNDEFLNTLDNSWNAISEEVLNKFNVYLVNYILAKD